MLFQITLCKAFKMGLLYQQNSFKFVVTVHKITWESSGLTKELGVDAICYGQHCFRECHSKLFLTFCLKNGIL